MKPERIAFYVYAANAEEAAALQDALHDFVSSCYDRGVIVTAERLTDLLRKVEGSPLINSIFYHG